MRSTRRLTVAQAVVEFLAQQWSERDGHRQRLVAGCFGIFGHGNVAGVGQALQQAGPRLPYHQARNEQAMVHTAAAFARMTDRLSILACTSSIGPGATNMVTGAAGATINRLPVLLLPGDYFAGRGPAPVLQQLEHPVHADVSVNDCLRPVSRWFDRIVRPEQLVTSLPQAMRVLTDPAETGTVTIALPEDVQVQAFDYPEDLFAERVWHVRRPPAEPGEIGAAADLLRTARRPVVVAGGGVVYSGATAALTALVDATGVPVLETQAGKGALPADHPLALGAVGATGTPAANACAAEADLVIGVGTRWTDFTTSSHTLFASPGVRFVNVNVAAFDAAKHAGLAVVADARCALEQLGEAVHGHRVPGFWRETVAARRAAWRDERTALLEVADDRCAPTQAQVLGAVMAAAHPRDVVVNAAGSMPGDLHKLFDALDRKSYHVEYGYSCMGYEIAGGLGVRMAAPDREVFVLVGDASYLMMSSELVTAVAEGHKLVVVIVQNHGYASIGSLSESLGSGRFGTEFAYADGAADGRRGRLPVDLAANAESLGAAVLRAGSVRELREALSAARAAARTTVVHVETAPGAVPSYGWWDVPVAEVSEDPQVQQARERYAAQRPPAHPWVRPSRQG